MPIANCIVRDGIPPDLEAAELIDAWSAESGVEPRHMTVNLIVADAQAGAPFAAMAFLYLPSLWSAEKVDDLQVGLQRAIERSLGLTGTDIQVVTTVVASGHVVADGRIEEWPAPDAG